MAKDPAFLFYSSDFLTGTLVMSFEDRGKYITILSYMHQNGRISEETIRLLVGSISDTLRLKFGIDKNNLWFNDRLEEEIEKRKNFVSSRKENGKKGGRPPKKQTSLNNENKKPTHNLPEDENVIVNKDDNEVEDNKGVQGEIKSLQIKKELTPLEVAFMDFSDMRKNIKKPLTKKAAELIYNKLEVLAPGNDFMKIKILHQSIMNSWQGVFEITNYKQNGQSQYTKEAKQQSVDEIRSEAHRVLRRD